MKFHNFGYLLKEGVKNLWKNRTMSIASIGVLIEKNWLNIAEGSVSREEMAKNIRLAGPEHTYLATDRGQAGAEHPAEGMLRFIETLLELGFSREEIDWMTKKVPQRIAAQG